MAQTATSVVVAPLVEEFMKGLAFLPLLLLGKQVDNRTDGLIYGAAAGLGFACVENLYYYIKVFDPDHLNLLIQTVFLRTLFTTLVHCVSSALLGYGHRPCQPQAWSDALDRLPAVWLCVGRAQPRLLGTA